MFCTLMLQASFQLFSSVTLIFLIYFPFLRTGEDEVVTRLLLIFFLSFISPVLNVLPAFSSSNLFRFLEN